MLTVALDLFNIELMYFVVVCIVLCLGFVTRTVISHACFSYF